MGSHVVDSLSGLVDFFSYFGMSIVFVVLFCQIYCWITPYNELKLVKEGNLAPAISFGGALVGFTLPLYSAITHSVSFIDMLIWGVIAMIVQLAVFSIVRLFFKGLVRDIESNQIASATLLAFFSLSIGILNAASITY